MFEGSFKVSNGSLMNGATAANAAMPNAVKPYFLPAVALKMTARNAWSKSQMHRRETITLVTHD